MHHDFDFDSAEARTTFLGMLESRIGALPVHYYADGFGIYINMTEWEFSIAAEAIKEMK
ncbi:MAG: hypothetical protein ACREHG_00020 [Candidatus Saccharimonadales bacterium]